MIRYRGKNNPRESHPKITIYVHTRVAEVEYFRSFKDIVKSPSLLVIPKPIITKPQDMIEQIISILNSSNDMLEGIQKDHDEVWVVLDVDDFYKQDKEGLLQIIKKAHDIGIKIAVSNECFELWYIVHFEKITHPIKRGDPMTQKIQGYFKKHNLGTYNKNKNIFDVLQPFQEQAIKNASSMVPNYESIIWADILDQKNNPITTLHFLVKSIRDKCKLS